MIRKQQRLALLVILQLLSSVLLYGNASADVRQNFYLVTPSPIPANGILRFTHEEAMTVRIVATDGAEVTGRFVAPGIWRPDEPFELGQYLADVSFPPSPERAEDTEFEVVAALEPSLAFLEIQVTPTVEAGAVLTQACCEAGSPM
jgi:hypothetical protein